MNVLLLRLAGPMQSWGVQSRFSIRETGREPSKSGVVGLLCAALGRRRNQDISDIAALKMGVRVDQEGVLKYDFHTAQNVRKASGGIKDTEPSRRYYLSDAKFLAGFGGEDISLLRELHAALRNPVWPLSLGRKAFVPSEPIWLEDAIHGGELFPVLQNAYLPTDAPAQYRYVLEDDDGSEVRPDQPISFATRTFALRRVTTIVPAAEEDRDVSLPINAK